MSKFLSLSLNCFYFVFYQMDPRNWSNFLMTTHKHKILSLIILTISHLNCYANTLMRVLCSVDSCENCDVFSLMDSVKKLQTFLLWLSA